MKIQARILGVIEGALVKREGEMELPAGITLMEGFKNGSDFFCLTGIFSVYIFTFIY